MDDAGPAFGEAALAALSRETGPLAGIEVVFQHTPYDWAQAANLEPVLSKASDSGTLAICSSEGGLFEYGSDDEIVSNLKVLRACSAVVAVIGSVTRADEPIQRLRRVSSARLILGDYRFSGSWFERLAGTSHAPLSAHSAIRLFLPECRFVSREKTSSARTGDRPR